MPRPVPAVQHWQENCIYTAMTKKKNADGARKSADTRPIRKKEDVAASNDNRIDEDFPGYPHHPANEKNINPKTREEKTIADTDRHNGSAGAFEATESGSDE